MNISLLDYDNLVFRKYDLFQFFKQSHVVTFMPSYCGYLLSYIGFSFYFLSYFSGFGSLQYIKLAVISPLNFNSNSILKP